MGSIRKLSLVIATSAALALGCGSGAQKGINKGLDKPRPGKVDDAGEGQSQKKAAG
jgi:hypothetical protein